MSDVREPETRVEPPPAGPDPALPPLKEKIPGDPRRSPAVVKALKYAAKRDPAPDVFKPVGRGAFLIWAVILLGFAGLYGATPMRAQVSAAEDVWKTTGKTVEGLAGSNYERSHTLKKLNKSPETVFKLTVAGFAAGSGLFAGYYALVYLFGLPLMRVSAATGRTINRRILKPAARAAGRAIERAKARRLVKARDTSAGPQPKLQ